MVLMNIKLLPLSCFQFSGSHSKSRGSKACRRAPQKPEVCFLIFCFSSRNAQGFVGGWLIHVFTRIPFPSWAFPPSPDMGHTSCQTPLRKCSWLQPPSAGISQTGSKEIANNASKVLFKWYNCISTGTFASTDIFWQQKSEKPLLQPT